MLPKNLRIHAILIVACIFMILYPLYNQKPDNEKVEQAAPVAEKFLEMLDQGQYAESWQSSAQLMQGKIEQNVWVEQLTKARTLSGDVVSRERKGASYSTEAQDSPDGEYIMLTYESSFQKASEVTEYVTLALEEGRWKIAGYFME